MMEKVETYSKPQTDEGEERRQVVFGGVRVISFVKDVVAGKMIDGKRYRFDEELIMEIHDRVSMAPGTKGFLRQTDSSTIGGEPVRAHFKELPFRMKLFGRWLDEQMERLRNEPDNLIQALEIAAAAHYGLTYPGFHPFDNGNGRTARALMNAILMSQSYELTAHGLAIPPIPIVRTDKDSGHYIRSLRAIGQTGTLNPLMTFIAQLWVKSLNERLEKIDSKIKIPQSNSDKLLIQKLEKRRELLREFIKSGVPENKNGNGHPKGNGHDSQAYQIFPIPDYFSLRYIKVDNA